MPAPGAKIFRFDPVSKSNEEFDLSSFSPFVSSVVPISQDLDPHGDVVGVTLRDGFAGTLALSKQMQAPRGWCHANPVWTNGTLSDCHLSLFTRILRLDVVQCLRQLYPFYCPHVDLSPCPEGDLQLSVEKPAAPG